MSGARRALQGSNCQEELPQTWSQFINPMLIVLCKDMPSPSQHRQSNHTQFRQVGMVPISGRGNEVEASDSKDNEHAESENIDNYLQISLVKLEGSS